MHQVVRRLARTRFTRRRINHYVMFLWVALIRVHLCTFLCCILNFGPVLNFWIHTIIPIILYFSSSSIYRLIEPCKDRSYALVSTLVKQYTVDCFKWYKKMLLFICTIYGIIILQFIDVTSSVLVIWLLQNLLYCLVIDCVEEEKWRGLWRAYRSCRSRRRYLTKVQLDSPIHIRENYILSDHLQQTTSSKSRVSVPTMVRYFRPTFLVKKRFHDGGC